MAKKRKRKPHACINHAMAIASGRCEKCGAWLCKDCSSLRQGRYTCTNGCVSQTHVNGKSEKATQTPPSSKSKSSLEKPTAYQKPTFQPAMSASTTRPSPGQQNQLLVLLGIALVACFAYSVLITIKLQNLSTEVAALKESLRKKTPDLLQPMSTNPVPSTEQKSDTLPPVSTDSESSQMPVRAMSKAETYSGKTLSFDRGSNAFPLLALTFDGDAMNNAANDILDTLLSRNVKVTFFVTGTFVRKNSDIIRRMLAEGHEIGNHTNTHPHLTTWEKDQTQTLAPGVTEAFIIKQLSDANSHMVALTGHGYAPIWRSPYGDFNRTLSRAALSQGWQHVGWSQGRTWHEGFDTNDWIPDSLTPGFRTPAQVLEKFKQTAEQTPQKLNGVIVLMHLGTQRKDPSMQVHYSLGILIDYLKEKGYSCVTVSELMEKAGLTPQKSSAETL
jgi:peptidoglycan/xylan/chitin deacetylase (PgdA/CDA1 family)